MGCSETASRFRRVRRFIALIFFVAFIITYHTSETAARRVGLTIVPVDNPILHQPALPVEFPTAEDREAIARMKEYLAKEPASFALAAPQVGLSRQFFVIKDGPGIYAVYNPRIIRHSQDVEAWPERCLSISYPVKGLVPRYTEVVIWGQDEDWQPVTIAAAGLTAKIMQHEIDHLQGLTILDRAVEQLTSVELAE